MFKNRDYQEDTLCRLEENYEKGIRRNLIVLFTGSGKTHISTQIHKRILPKEKTLFIVDRIDLAYQAKEAFERSYPELSIGLEMDVHKASKKNDIVIASVQTIGKTGSHKIEKFSPDHFKKIIVDEVHGAATDIFFRVLNYFGAGPDCDIGDKMLIGATATPMRSDGVSLSCLFDDIVVNYDIVYGIKNGWLTDIQLIHIDTSTSIADVKGDNRRFNESQLSDTLNNPVRNALIVKSYMDISPGESALVYAASVDHAYELERLFNEHGITAKCIEANTDRDLRQQWISDYKEGKILVLINFSTLTTGFDAPETSALYLARPFKQDLPLRQTLGRGLRPSQLCIVDNFDLEDRLQILEHSVKPYCKVVDFCDSAGEHRLASVPSLFGLSPTLKNTNKSKKFFKEVVEPITETARETNTPINSIHDLSELGDIVANRKILDIKSLSVPEDISQHSDNQWLPTGDDTYETTYPKEGKTLIVEKNQLDQYELLIYDKANNNTKRLQTFQNLSGAITNADKLAQTFKDQTFKIDDKKGVTPGQIKFMTKILKGGMRLDRNETYPDTGQPIVYYRKTGERLNRKTASILIQSLLNK